MMINLKSRIQNRQSTIAIIGLGYVGLPLTIRFSEEGFKTIGFDIDKEKVDLLNDGKSYIKHIKEDNIAFMASNGFKATSDFGEITSVDVIIICVPTPLGIHNEPDLSFIHGTLENIKPYLKENQLLVLESTTYPGTTEEILVPFIESIPDSSLITHHSSLFTIGENFFIGYSPEREDPGNKDFTTKTIPKIVSGYTENCLELTKILYDQIVDQTVSVSSPKVAEMTKIMENIHRAVNIGLVNELKVAAEKMGVDIWEVIDAAATKPFGFKAFYPGPGLGGHCISIDPFYLTWKAREFGVHTRFIELAGEINTSMPHYVVSRTTEALNSRSKSVRGSKILLMGLAYKENVDDMRESPTFHLLEELAELGAEVAYYDPHVPVIGPTREHARWAGTRSIEWSEEEVASYDCVLIATNHAAFDLQSLLNAADLVVDTRNAIAKAGLQGAEGQVVKA